MVEPAAGDAPAGHRSGFVAVLGVPNAGKSTLVNRLAGRRVSGVSPKPQTTRRAILGVLTEPRCQVVFVDTPGFGVSRDALGEMMASAAVKSGRDADLVLYVIDAEQPEDGAALAVLLKGRTRGSILVPNKIDRVEKPALLPLIGRFAALHPFEAVVPVSAADGDGREALLGEIRRRLPEGPRWYDAEASPEAVSALVQEAVQEQLFRMVHQEVPYGSAVQIERVEREGDLTRAEAVILVEREGHKPIVIGQGGRKIKEIGTAARLELERALGGRVFLKLWVRVETDWRNRAALLADLGYATSGRAG